VDEAGRRDGLLPIGRFSQLTRLSVKGLRLYDERGLLEPAFVDPVSGYRYYDSSQAQRAEAIRVLRGVGMSLDQIGEVLGGGPEKVGALLRAHREALLAQAQDAANAAALVQDVMEGRRPLVSYEITTETAAEQHVAALRIETDLAEVGTRMEAGFGHLMKALAETGSPPTGMPFAVYPDVIDEETSGHIELCMPTSPQFPGQGDVVAKTLPQHLAVTTVHRGRYSDLAPAYHALSAWMQAHGVEPAEAPREMYLNDPREVGEAETLTKVVWPVAGTPTP